MESFALLWDCVPQLIHHSYYYHKKQFQSAVDTYPVWAAFAVEEGSFTYRIGKEAGSAQAGDVLICPPHTPFGRRCEQPVSFHYFRFHWNDAEGQPVAFDALQAQLTAKWTIHDKNRLFSNYLQLRKIHHLAHPASWLLRNHLFQDILRLYFAEELLPELSVVHKKNDPIMIKAEQEIRRNYDQPLTIQSIASLCGLSPVQFTRRFQAAFQMKPSDYISSLRLKKAQYLLLQPALTNDDIAKQCGFDNGFYFSRVFSRKMNMSPSEFREAHQV